MRSVASLQRVDHHPRAPHDSLDLVQRGDRLRWRLHARLVRASGRLDHIVIFWIGGYESALICDRVPEFAR